MYDIEKIQKEVNKAVLMIRKGYPKERIIKKIKGGIFPKEKVFEMAKCRIKARKKFGKDAENLLFDEIGLRYATPPQVAEYRAKRIGAESVADLGCGVGIQLLYFARNAERCVGVERDDARAKMAMLNAMAMGLENVEVIRGNALESKIVGRIDEEVIFCDPAREPEEERRKFDTLSPNPMDIFTLYKGKKMAFEIPPRIHRSEIKIEGEKEYTSLNFRLNRLALYTGELARCDVSAISLPSEERVSNIEEEAEAMTGRKIMNYVYEVDGTIMKAGLLKNLLGKLSFDGYLISSSKRSLLSSDGIYSSSFLRRYEVMKTCNFSRSKINRELRKLEAGKAILRFSISPEEYWRVRNSIEEGFDGDKTYYIFRVGDRAVIARVSQTHS